MKATQSYCELPLHNLEMIRNTSYFGTHLQTIEFAVERHRKYDDVGDDAETIEDGKSHYEVEKRSLEVQLMHENDEDCNQISCEKYQEGRSNDAIDNNIQQAGAELGQAQLFF